MRNDKEYIIYIYIQGVEILEKANDIFFLCETILNTN